MLQEATAPRLQPNLDQVRAEPGARGAGGAGQRTALPETGPPPQDLTWTDVAPAEKLRVIEQLAAQSRGNYEKIKTWRGVYAYVLRQRLDEPFVAQLLAGAQLTARGGWPIAKAEPLMQEFDSVLTFAFDAGSNSLYRDIETSRIAIPQGRRGGLVPRRRLGRDDLQPQREDRLAALPHAPRRHESTPGHRGRESILRAILAGQPAPALQRRPVRATAGIWVVNLDGKDRRRILPTGKGTASACWSPDGQRIAVAIGGSEPEDHGRLEIVNLDGTHRTLLTLPAREIADMPDWR